jgi:dUTP pyrophosphatase
MTNTVTGEDYVANIYPRSSLFKNFGLILTNHVGCIDNSYKGTTDYWRGMLVAMRSGEVSKYDRLCQFEIKKPQPKITLHEVDDLGNVARDGYGTSGKQ